VKWHDTFRSANYRGQVIKGVEGLITIDAETAKSKGITQDTWWDKNGDMTIAPQYRNVATMSQDEKGKRWMVDIVAYHPFDPNARGFRGAYDGVVMPEKLVPGPLEGEANNEISELDAASSPTGKALIRVKTPEGDEYILDKETKAILQQRKAGQ
jgi:hypothetical protein